MGRRWMVVGGATAGALGLTTVAGRTLLARQAATARRLIGKPLGDQPPAADRVWKAKHGNPVDLLLLGDSIAAGLGAEHRKDTLGGRLAKGLAKQTGRAVRLRTGAVVGAESSMLADQVAALPTGYRPEVVVVVVGGNDVTHRVPAATSVRHLVATIEDMRSRGAEVVVGTCPDLGALRPVPQPLRALGSRASRQLAEAQREAARDAGAFVVSLSAVVGPFFVTNPDEMFSLDRFHPSAAGYRRTAAAMLPSVVAALHRHDEELLASLPFGHHAPHVV